MPGGWRMREVRAFPERGRSRARGRVSRDPDRRARERRHFYRRNPALWTGEAIFSDRVAGHAAVCADRRPVCHRRRRGWRECRRSSRRRAARSSPSRWVACAGTGRVPGRGDSVRPESAGVGCPTRRPTADGPRLQRSGGARRGTAFRAFAAWLQQRLTPAPTRTRRVGRAVLSLLLTARSLVHDAARGPVAGRRGTRWTRRTPSSRNARAPLGASRGRRGRGQAAARPADDYLPRFARTGSASARRADEYDLVSWPDAPIRYVPIPEHTREAAPLLYYLFYRSPAPFDPAAPHDYVVSPIDGLPDEDVERRLAAANDARSPSITSCTTAGSGITCRTGSPRARVADRAGRGGRRRQPHRDVLRADRWPRAGPATSAT